MVFSRLVVACVFLLTVILIPVSIPETPTRSRSRVLVPVSGDRGAPAVAPVRRLPPLPLLDLYDAVRAVGDVSANDILAADPRFADRLAAGLCSTSLTDARPAALAVLARIGDNARLDRVADDRVLALSRELIAASGIAPAPFVRRLLASRTASKLGRSGVPSVIRLLASSDAVIRRAAFDEIRATAKGVPVEAAEGLAQNVTTDDFAREGLVAIGAPAAPALEAQLATANGPAAAYVLARLAPLAWAAKITPVALRSLGENQTAGDARFGVMTLVAVGPGVRAEVRRLLDGDDDQAAVCAIDVLARSGGVTPEEVEAAAPALRRLALHGSDEPEAAIDAYAALGRMGELLLSELAHDDRPAVAARAVELWKACANPKRSAWVPEGRLPNFTKRAE